jgi:hypothetical protein
MECVFQPVSSSSSTAFIPVSALPNGVPPGTQLFGAYGQPLAPTTMPPHQSNAGHFQPPLQSPTAPYHAYDGQDGPSSAGRRRPRGSDELDEPRLPPPNQANPNDPRRRSPAGSSSHGSPPSQYFGPAPGAYDRPGTTHSPGGTSTGPAPSPLPRSSGAGYPQGGYEGTTPPPAQSSANQLPPSSSSSIMSVNNLVDNTSDIDRSMLGKLDRRSRK